MTPTDGTADELTRLAELAAGRRIMSQGSVVPISSAEWTDRWEQLRHSGMFPRRAGPPHGGSYWPMTAGDSGDGRPRRRPVWNRSTDPASSGRNPDRTMTSSARRLTLSNRAPAVAAAEKSRRFGHALSPAVLRTPRCDPVVSGRCREQLGGHDQDLRLRFALVEVE